MRWELILFSYHTSLSIIVCDSIIIYVAFSTARLSHRQPQPRDGAGERGHDGENADNLELAPAALLEVVVDRRHLKEPLAVRELEISDLQDHRKSLRDVDDPRDHDD